MNHKCMTCAGKVEKYVGFDKPIPNVFTGGGSEGNWWESEGQIEGVEASGDKVITLMLNENVVSRLHGPSDSAPPLYQ